LSFPDATPASAAGLDPAAGFGFRAVRTGRAFEAVVEQIRSALKAGRYRVGEQLPPERELAAVFGVSRTVVREAIRVLELSGLLIVRHGGTPGVFVAPPPPRPLSLALRTLLKDEEFTIRELFAVNIFIERSIAEEAARVVTAEDLADLAAHIQASQRILEQGGRPTQQDVDFHRRLVRVLGNRLLTDLEWALAETARRVGDQGNDDQRLFRTTIRQHQHILSALRAHSPARAGRAMTMHLKTMETFFLLDAEA
jgi:GntR family transcriptional repressor for pyruvate dehydrogenase complex